MKPYTYALLAVLSWGMAPIFGKLGLAKTDPMIGLSIRTLVTVLFLLITLGARNEFHQFLTLDKFSLGMLALEGLFASALGHLFYFYALKFGEASRITFIMAAYPLVTYIAAMIILKEGFSLTKLGGAVFILAGVFLLTK
ncbi:EamA family transporter [Candidatus Formimonas warabiya]|nr:EamA family transporter [Candidatus Formimonas warabiya]